MKVLATLGVDFIAENIVTVVIFILCEILNLLIPVPSTVGPIARFFNGASGSEVNPYCFPLVIIGLSLSVLVLTVLNWKTFMKNLQIQNMEELVEVSAKKKFGYIVFFVAAVFLVMVIGVFLGCPSDFFMALSYPFAILLFFEALPYLIITVFLPIIPVSRLAVLKLGIKSKFLRIIAIILGAVIFIAFVIVIAILTS